MASYKPAALEVQQQDLKGKVAIVTCAFFRSRTLLLHDADRQASPKKKSWFTYLFQILPRDFIVVINILSQPRNTSAFFERVCIRILHPPADEFTSRIALVNLLSLSSCLAVQKRCNKRYRPRHLPRPRHARLFRFGQLLLPPICPPLRRPHTQRPRLLQSRTGQLRGFSCPLSEAPWH
jgi:hypothetical protein